MSHGSVLRRTEYWAILDPSLTPHVMWREGEGLERNWRCNWKAAGNSQRAAEIAREIDDLGYARAGIAGTPPRARRSWPSPGIVGIDWVESCIMHSSRTGGPSSTPLDPSLPRRAPVHQRAVQVSTACGSPAMGPGLNECPMISACASVSSTVVPELGAEWSPPNGAVPALCLSRTYHRRIYRCESSPAAVAGIGRRLIAFTIQASLVASNKPTQEF
jgi:hypothetical protein